MSSALILHLRSVSSYYNDVNTYITVRIMKKDINVTLGSRIKQLRKERGYTREAFAEKIDVSSRFLADLESGKVGVSISTLKQIALEMNVSSDFLIGITVSENYNPEKEGIIMKINKIPVSILIR